MHSIKSGLMALAAFTGTFSSSALSETVQELDALVIEARTPEDEAQSPSLTVPTAGASRADLEKTPGGVEVIDSERYLTGRASTVADTFALSAGVFAQPRFGSDEARLSIRGSGLQRTFHGRGLLDAGRRD